MSPRLPTALLIALCGIVAVVASCSVSHRPPAAPGPSRRMAFEATAYSIEGKTADGSRAREGIVAADPRVLPLGTRIRVHGAGDYSGEYVVSDTGRAVKGHEIDVYLADDREAKRFGRKPVEVEIVRPAANP